MKKKLLFVALPTFMALSGCSNANLQKAEKIINNDEFAICEDTTAHEELFGAADLGIRKIGVPDTDPGSTSVPRVGVQFSGIYKDDVLDGEGNPTGEKADYYAVRFVAAIKGDLSTQTVLWTRGVSQVDSTQVKGMSSVGRGDVPLNSTAVYTSLNDNGVATGVPSGYDNFVVYTMYDIPVSEANSYIAAYVTITPKAGGSSVSSFAVVTEIDGGHYFNVQMEEDLPRNGYFLDFYNDSGLSPTNNIVAEDNAPLTDTDPSNDAKDNAMFSDITFSEGDKVGAFRLTPSIFQFYGYNAFMGSTASGYVKETSVNDFAEAHRTGIYTIFLNKDNVVYFAPNDVTGLTFNFVAWGDWDSDNARIEVYCFNEYNGNTASEFMIWEKTGTHTYSFSPSHWGYSKIIFVRMDKTQPSGNWDSKWNQSGDIGVGLDLTKTTFTLTQPNSWDDWTASWIAS